MALVLKVGDKVSWRGCFGSSPPREATVTELSVTEHPRSKYGEEVQAVSWDLVRENQVLCGLDCGHWAYSEQIAPVGMDPRAWHRRF